MANKEVELVNIKTTEESAKPQENEKSTVADTESAVNETVKPRLKIRPELSEEDAIKLAERLYGITTSEICPLISYDDRNFLIHVDRNIKNPIIPNTWPHGYVMKIANTWDTQNSNVFDAQTQLLLFLSQQNIQCPRPVMNIYGKYYSSEKLGSGQHNVRLLEYQPGKTFQEVLKTNHLYYQVGEFMAKVDNSFKNFQHEAFENYNSLWRLESLPKLSEFLYVITDVHRKDIVEQVLKAFENEVIPNLHKFSKGLIHGDFNEHNILVNKTDKPNEWKVTGIIDFGDTSYSYYIFELAIAMAYVLLQSDDIETGGLVIAGYSMIRNVPAQELKVLKICVAARLCQSLVLGIYTHAQQPENDYVLYSQKAGWELLEQLWTQDSSALDESWSKIADDYLKQSHK